LAFPTSELVAALTVRTGGEGRNRPFRAYFWAILAHFKTESVRIGRYGNVPAGSGLVFVLVFVPRAS